MAGGGNSGPKGPPPKSCAKPLMHHPYCDIPWSNYEIIFVIGLALWNCVTLLHCAITLQRVLRKRQRLQLDEIYLLLSFGITICLLIMTCNAAGVFHGWPFSVAPVVANTFMIAFGAEMGVLINFEKHILLAATLAETISAKVKGMFIIISLFIISLPIPVLVSACEAIYFDSPTGTNSIFIWWYSNIVIFSLSIMMVFIGCGGMLELKLIRISQSKPDTVIELLESFQSSWLGSLIFGTLMTFFTYLEFLSYYAVKTEDKIISMPTSPGTNFWVQLIKLAAITLTTFCHVKPLSYKLVSSTYQTLLHPAIIGKSLFLSITILLSILVPMWISMDYGPTITVIFIGICTGLQALRIKLFNIDSRKKYQIMEYDCHCAGRIRFKEKRKALSQFSLRYWKLIMDWKLYYISDLITLFLMILVTTSIRFIWIEKHNQLQSVSFVWMTSYHGARYIVLDLGWGDILYTIQLILKLVFLARGLLYLLFIVATFFNNGLRIRVKNFYFIPYLDNFLYIPGTILALRLFLMDLDCVDDKMLLYPWIKCDGNEWHRATVFTSLLISVWCLVLPSCYYLKQMGFSPQFGNCISWAVRTRLHAGKLALITVISMCEPFVIAILALICMFLVTVYDYCTPFFYLLPKTGALYFTCLIVGMMLHFATIIDLCTNFPKIHGGPLIEIYESPIYFGCVTAAFSFLIVPCTVYYDPGRKWIRDEGKLLMSKVARIRYLSTHHLHVDKKIDDRDLGILVHVEKFHQFLNASLRFGTVKEEQEIDLIKKYTLELRALHLLKKGCSTCCGRLALKYYGEFFLSFLLKYIPSEYSAREVGGQLRTFMDTLRIICVTNMSVIHHVIKLEPSLIPVVRERAMSQLILDWSAMDPQAMGFGNAMLDMDSDGEDDDAIDKWYSDNGSIHAQKLHRALHRITGKVIARLKCDSDQIILYATCDWNFEKKVREKYGGPKDENVMPEYGFADGFNTLVPSETFEENIFVHTETQMFFGSEIRHRNYTEKGKGEPEHFTSPLHAALQNAVWNLMLDRCHVWLIPLNMSSGINPYCGSDPIDALIIFPPRLQIHQQMDLTQRMFTVAGLSIPITKEFDHYDQLLMTAAEVAEKKQSMQSDDLSDDDIPDLAIPEELERVKTKIRLLQAGDKRISKVLNPKFLFSITEEELKDEKRRVSRQSQSNIKDRVDFLNTVTNNNSVGTFNMSKKKSEIFAEAPDNVRRAVSSVSSRSIANRTSCRNSHFRRSSSRRDTAQNQKLTRMWELFQLGDEDDLKDTYFRKKVLDKLEIFDETCGDGTPRAVKSPQIKPLSDDMLQHFGPEINTHWNGTFQFYLLIQKLLLLYRGELDQITIEEDPEEEIN